METILKWLLVSASSALSFGALSTLIAARRLYFLAGTLPHASLLSSILSVILLSGYDAYHQQLAMIAIGVVLTYSVSYLIHRGVDSDVAVSVFLAGSSSLSVVLIFYLLTSYELEANLWALVVGDPLLVEWPEVLQTSVVGLLAVTAVVLTYKRQVLIGVDRDHARTLGVRVSFYDWVAYSTLALVMVGLVRIVGFVLEHVLALLPAALAMLVARSSSVILPLSVSLSVAASLLGLTLSILFNYAPSGLTGLLLTVIYVATLLLVRGRRG